VSQQYRQLRAAAGAPTLDGPGGNSEEFGRLRHRVTLDIDGNDRRTLLGGQGVERTADRHGQVDGAGAVMWVGELCNVELRQRNGPARLIAADTIQASIDDNPMQP